MKKFRGFTLKRELILNGKTPAKNFKFGRGTRAESSEKENSPGFSPGKIINVRLQGFTLIELLVIIAILGILATAVLVAVNPTKRRNQSKDAIIKNDISSIASVLEVFYVSKGGYPHGGTAMTELVAKGELDAPIMPPSGGPSDYYIRTFPPDCATAGPILCTSTSVFYPLFDPAVPENLWCYRSSLAKASEVTFSAGCPAS